MKRCPECRRDYFDDSMLYCLDDGSLLLAGPVGAERASLSGAETLRIDFERSAVRTSSLDRPPGLARSDDLNTVAVLPFADLSYGENSEYFSDGLAEELSNVLSKIRGLRVAARTSAFAFRGKQVGVAEIGKALRVRSILEGSVRIAGQRVRVSVQLVDAVNGYQLWSETYDRTMDDIFAIQDDIAGSVVAELRERFFAVEGNVDSQRDVADELTVAVKGRSAHPASHRLMLMGKYLFDRLNEDDAEKAVGYFSQALEVDPTYALCWAELGRLYYAASNHGWSGLDSGYQKAEECLQRALDLEPNLAEAHARLGCIRWYRDADFAEAARSLKRALDLAPDNVDVLLSVAPTAREQGQFEIAAEHCRRAVAIDPLSATAWSTSAVVSFLAGRVSQAEYAARRALELAPQRIIVHACLSMILLDQGRIDDALEQAMMEPENTAWRPWALAMIYWAAKRNSDSDDQTQELIKGHSANSAFQIAEVHSYRGEADKAFYWLECAIQQRDPGRLAAMASPFLRGLRTDKRWNDVLSRIGFPTSTTTDHSENPL